MIMRLATLSGIVCMALAILPLASCEKTHNDDPEPNPPVIPVDPSDPDNPGADGNVMTPTAAYTYIKNTALDALARFNPEDQREILQVSKSFVEIYGDYDMPYEFGDGYKSPAKLIGELGDAVSRHNPFGITRASYDSSISDFAGIYEPDTRAMRWIRTGDSESVVFRAPLDGQTVQIQATPSDGEWSPDDETGIPRKIVTTVTYGRTRLSSVSVNSFADLDRGIVNLNIVAEAANITATVRIDGSNSKITENGRLAVGGSEVVSGDIIITGSRLCDVDAWESEDDMSGMLRDAILSLDFLDRVFVSAHARDLENCMDALDSWYDSYDGVSQAQAEKEVTDACRILNGSLTSEVRFAASGPVQASLYWMPYVYCYNNVTSGVDYWEVSPAAAVRYAYDGSTERIENVDFDFDIVADRLESLIGRYADFMRSLR